MTQKFYSPLDQFRVLHAVEAQCGLYGEKIVQLDVADLDSEAISKYCRLLKELGMIDTTTYQDMAGDLHYPIRVTPKGMEFLTETNRAFWEQAEKVATDMVKHWTGFDIASATKFFRTVRKKYKQDQGAH